MGCWRLLRLTASDFFEQSALLATAQQGTATLLTGPDRGVVLRRHGGPLARRPLIRPGGRLLRRLLSRFGGRLLALLPSSRVASLLLRLLPDDLIRAGFRIVTLVVDRVRRLVARRLSVPLASPFLRLLLGPVDLG